LWCNYNQQCYNALLYPDYCPIGKILSATQNCLSYNTDTKTYVAITVVIALGVALTIVILFLNKMNSDKNVEKNYRKYRPHADSIVSSKLQQIHNLVHSDTARKIEPKEGTIENESADSEPGDDMTEIMITPTKKKGKHSRKTSLTANNLRNLT